MEDIFGLLKFQILADEGEGRPKCHHKPVAGR